MDRAIEEALRASPELEQIQQGIGAAAEQVVQAEASFYPRRVLSEDFNVTDNPVYALMNIVNQRRFNPLAAGAWLHWSSRAGSRCGQTDERLGEARLHAEMALPSEVLRLKEIEARGEQ